MQHMHNLHSCSREKIKNVHKKVGNKTPFQKNNRKQNIN